MLNIYDGCMSKKEIITRDILEATIERSNTVMKEYIDTVLTRTVQEIISHFNQSQSLQNESISSLAQDVHEIKQDVTVVKSDIVDLKRDVRQLQAGFIEYISATKMVSR